MSGQSKPISLLGDMMFLIKKGIQVQQGIVVRLTLMAKDKSLTRKRLKKVLRVRFPWSWRSRGIRGILDITIITHPPARMVPLFPVHVHDTRRETGIIGQHPRHNPLKGVPILD